MMNTLLRCLVVTPVLAGLTACMPGPEPIDRSTVTTGTSTMSANSDTNARANRTANTAANTAAPAPTTTPAPPTPAPMTADEREAVSELQWVHTADAARDAGNALAQAKAQGQKPAVMAFVQRGLSYPGLNRAQMSKIRRKVHDKIVEGSGDMIFGPTHRQLRQKLRTYAIAYNRAILAAMQ